MKRLAVCLLIAAICASALCGCGARDERLDEMVVGTPVIPDDALSTPLVTPMPTPDAADGVVMDGDGLIEDTDTGRVVLPDATMKPDQTTPKTDKTTVSPSPAVTAKP